MNTRAEYIRRPVTVLAVLFVAGVWLGASFPGLRCVFFIIALGLTMAGAFLFAVSSFGFVVKRMAFRNAGVVVVYVAVLMLAAAYTGVRGVSAESGFNMDKPREGLEIRGVVKERPTLISRGSGAHAVATFSVSLVSIRRLQDWQSARGYVKVFLALNKDEADLLPGYGEEWVFSGVLKDNLFANNGAVKRSMDEVRYVFSGGIEDAVCVATRKMNIFSLSVFRIRQKCEDILSTGLEKHPDVSGVLKAILIGTRSDLPADAVDSLFNTGTFHIMAISGLHVGIIVVLLSVFLRVIGVSSPWWFVFLAPIVVVYAVIVGMRPSVIRAGIMTLVFFAGPFIGRKPDPLSALGLATILTLVYNPFQLFDAGFVFSFVIVGMLILYCPLIISLFAQNRLSGALGQLSFTRIILRKIGFALFNLIVVSAVAWLASAPLSAFFFNRITPAGIILNIAIIPVVFLVVFTGLVTLAAGFVSPFLAGILNSAQILPVTAILETTDLAACVPGAFFNVASPPGWGLILLYSGLWCFAVVPVGRKRLPAAFLVLLAVWFMVLLVLSFRSAYVDVMPAGDMAVVFVNTPEGKVLFDTGSPFYAEQAARYLRKQGVNTIDKLVVTRGDYHAVGGFERLVKQFSIRKIVCFSEFRKNSSGGRLLEFAANHGIPVVIPEGTAGGLLATGIEWMMAKGDVSGKTEPVFILDYRGGRVLLLCRASPGQLSYLAKELSGDPPDVIVTYDRRMAMLFNDKAETANRACVLLFGVTPVGDKSKRICSKGGVVLAPCWNEFVRMEFRDDMIDCSLEMTD